MIIQDKEGTSFEAFAEAHLTGNIEVIDFMVSAPSREILEQVALASNLMVHDEDGNLQNALYCDSSWIGCRMIQDAVMGESGETIIPAVFSEEYLVNWRLGPRPKLGRDGDGYELWQLTCAAWAKHGVLVQLTDTLRAYELQGVRQIDSNGIKTPLRVWAD